MQEMIAAKENETMKISEIGETIEYYVSPGLVDETTDEGVLTLYQIRSESENRLANQVGKELEIIGYMIHNAVVSSIDGCKKNAARVILVDKDMVPYVAVSQGIYNSLKTIVTTAGEPSPERRFKIVVQEKQGKNKFKFKELKLTGIVR